MTAAAVPFKHPPTPPAIPGDFVPTTPKRTIPEVIFDTTNSALDAILTAEILEVLL